MLDSIGSGLKISMQKAGIVRQVDAARVCELWESVVCEIFGNQVAEKSQALHFKNGALTVAVLNPVLAQEFKFKEEEIKEKLNKGRKELVRKIRFEA